MPDKSLINFNEIEKKKSLKRFLKNNLIYAGLVSYRWICKTAIETTLVARKH